MQGLRRIEDQVLIVGGGPVGLMTAYRLSTLGVRCTLFEAAADVAEDLRASTFHPPTLDMLDELGLAGPLVRQGRICPSWQIRVHETGEKAEFDLSVLRNDTRHPYRLQCEQFRLCRMLAAELSSQPLVDLRFNARVEELRQHDDGIAVDVEERGERRTYTGRILVGADGARSSVRERLGFSFDGATYPETTLLVTTQFPFEEHLPGLSNVNYVWTERGTFSLLHLPDRWRCSLYPDPDEDADAALSPQSVERKLQRIVARDGSYEILDRRAYRVHMRIVDDYRCGRAVLVGDAAHINSPAGGMGMNGGIHDAFALTDALRDIWHGAPLERLDAYTRQRRPIAASEILIQADRNRARMQERDPAKRREMFGDLKRITANPVLMREYLLRSSMIEGLEQSAKAA
jgi:3-(3-hydroxy-phenyl)propionate hydroxylase